MNQNKKSNRFIPTEEDLIEAENDELTEIIVDYNYGKDIQINECIFLAEEWIKDSSYKAMLEALANGYEPPETMPECFARFEFKIISKKILRHNNNYQFLLGLEKIEN